MDPIYNNESKNLSSIPENLRTEVVENSNSTYTQYTQIHLPAFLEKYQAYMPSRKIAIVIVMIIVALLGYIIVPKIPTMIKSIAGIFSNKKTLPIPKNPVTSAQPDKDSDGDGVPDWQEALFNLDPNDPDSNNDGTSDTVPSDLQKLANDPNIVNQGDKLVLEIISQLQKEGSVDNLTQAQLSEKVQTEILKMAEKVESEFTVYTQSDLTLTDNSPENLKSYNTAVSRIAKEVIPQGDILRKIYSYISVNDTKQYPRFYMNSLQVNISALLKMPVPRILSDEHLRLINGLSRIVGFIGKLNENIAYYENTDSYLKTIIIQKNINAIAKSVDNINLYFSLNK